MHSSAVVATLHTWGDKETGCTEGFYDFAQSIFWGGNIWKYATTICFDTISHSVIQNHDTI